MSDDTSSAPPSAARDLSPPSHDPPFLGSDSEAGSPAAQAVGFLPGEDLSPEALWDALNTAPEGRRLELLGYIVSFAPWDEVWSYVSPEELSEALPKLDLPESLRAAWLRYLDPA